MMLLVVQSVLFGLAPFACSAASEGGLVTILALVAALYGGCKIMLAPAIVHVMHKENANTAMGLAVVSMSTAAAVGPSLLTSLRSSGASSSPSSAYNSFFYVMSLLTAVGSFLLMPLRPLAVSERAVVHDQTGESDGLDGRPIASTLRPRASATASVASRGAKPAKTEPAGKRGKQFGQIDSEDEQLDRIANEA